MGLEGLRLRQQVQVVVVTSVVYPTLLLNLAFKLIDDLLFLVDGVLELGVVVADVPGLVLDDLALVLNFIDLAVLVFQLRLNLLFFALEVFNLRVQLIQFHLLPLDFLVVVSELLSALLLLFFDFLEFALRIEQVVLGLPEVLLRDPALPLLVTLLVHEVLQVGLLVAQLLLHLTVSVCDAVNLLLEQISLVRLLANDPFHLVYFLLALTDVVLDLVRLFVEVIHGALH